ncbi:hypothetical protein [Aeropyrum camini]|uniref:hypothetical protein n=1 Tax=Aeropyrum camini TaxID=229980 RepID=UPI0007897F6D|nr:hypothetical protein [Aeropyrum camini]
MIDYGLAEFSSSVEDRAVDLHLFRRAVESTHAPLAGELYSLYTPRLPEGRGGGGCGGAAEG